MLTSGGVDSNTSVAMTTGGTTGVGASVVEGEREDEGDEGGE